MPGYRIAKTLSYTIYDKNILFYPDKQKVIHNLINSREIFHKVHSFQKKNRFYVLITGIQPKSLTNHQLFDEIKGFTKFFTPFGSFLGIFDSFKY